MGASKTFYGEYNGTANALICEVIAFCDNRIGKYNALWDTGAMTTCISSTVRKHLNLERTGTARLKTIHNQREVPTYDMNLELPGGFRIFGLEVAEIERDNLESDIVIGMNVISLGDFAVSCFEGKTAFTFRFPSQGLINFNKYN